MAKEIIASQSININSPVTDLSPQPDWFCIFAILHKIADRVCHATPRGSLIHVEVALTPVEADELFCIGAHLEDCEPMTIENDRQPADTVRELINQSHFAWQ